MALWLAAAALALGGLRPITQEVELRIDPAEETFRGRVRIEVEVERPATVLWLNAKGLAVEEAWVEAGGLRLEARAETLEDEYLALVLREPVAAGRAVIGIRYTGRIDSQGLMGLYRRQVGEDWYVFSTFTPVEARRAFPCFDEPRYKQPWTVRLVIPERLRAYSNGRQVSETVVEEGWKVVRFGETGRLPAEVVALAVGPFEETEAAAAGRRGVAVRTVTPRGQAAWGKYATAVTDAVLRRLEEYTGIDYPWEKLDHVALPKGAFGAVENPGLITYVSSRLLMDPNAETEEKRRAVRGLMTHELAHQWFGNLVTQRTWEDVWLSEGFATWMTWWMMGEDGAAARERMMKLDESAKTRPVRLTMPDRKALGGVYSPFVYQKAGAVLLMLEGWLGVERWRAAVRRYLEKHRDGTATLEEFAAELGPEAGRVLRSFLDRAGVPVVEARAECGGEKAELVLREKTKGWAVPVCWRTPGEAACTLVEGEVRVKLGACPEWIEPNAGGTGYYRSEATAAGR